MRSTHISSVHGADRCAVGIAARNQAGYNECGSVRFSEEDVLSLKRKRAK